MALRTEFGTLYDDQLFADLYPPSGRPVEVAPWRLALVMVMQYIEGLTDRQAAPRQLTVSPQVHHEALQAARQRQETPQFKAQYALRAGGRVASRKGSGALICAGVDTLA